EDPRGITGGGSTERLKEEMGERAKNTVAVLEKYEDKSKLSLDSIQMVQELVPAVMADGGGLFSMDGKLYLVWDSYKYFALSSLEIGVDTLWEIGEALTGDDQYQDALWTYWDESKGFMAIMIGARALTEPVKVLINNFRHPFHRGSLKGGVVRGVIQGAKEGLTMPITIAKLHAFAGQDILRMKQDWKSKRTASKLLAEVERIKTAHGEGSPQHIESKATLKAAKLQRLKFYAEIFENYDKALDRAETWTSTEKGIVRHLSEKSWTGLNKERYLSLRRKFAIKFSDLYDEMSVGTNPELPPQAMNESVFEKPKIIAERIEKMKKALRDMKAEQITKKAVAIQEAINDSTKWAAMENKTLQAMNPPKIEELVRARGMEPGTTDAQKFLGEWAKELAKQVEETGKPNILSDFHVDGAKTPIEIVSQAGSGDAIVRYRGLDIKIPAAKMPPAAELQTLQGMEKIRGYCKKKWIVPAQAMTNIELKYDSRSGEMKWYRNGQDFKPEATAESIEKMQERYTKLLLEDKGIHVPEDFKGRIAKYGSVIPQLELVLGAAGTAYMLYEIEYATDKRATLIDQIAVLGSAMPAAWAFEKKIGSKVTNPWLHLFGVLASGIIGVALGKDAIEGIMNAVVPNIPGAHGVSLELGEILSKIMMVKFTLKPGIALIGRTNLGKRGIEMGANNIGKLLRNTGMHGKLKLIVGGKTFQRILVTAVGPKRAAVIVAGFADDALLLTPYAPIALATDVFDVGMIIWSGWDIYQIVKLVQNAEKLDKEMEARKDKFIDIKSLKILNAEANQSIRIKSGKINAASGFQELVQDEKALFDFLAQEPVAVIEFEREGMEGKEKWIFEKGKVKKVEIHKGGVLYAEMDDADASMLEEGFHEVERKEQSAIQTTTQGSTEKLAEVPAKKAV
ncbi:MAG: hypothetical protein ACD_28C00010G0010, partial [uncultured bacterium]